jgi:hypothetical protein
LGLWNLIIIGMVIIQPTAPMGIYGVISNKAHGHVVTTILIAMIAMLFTAISYGRMARIYERRVGLPCGAGDALSLGTLSDGEWHGLPGESAICVASVPRRP